MKLLLMSDMHLESHLPGDDFFNNLSPETTVLVTGDLANNYSGLYPAIQWLENMPCEYFFVLGNHDFWGSGLYAVRHELKSNMNYLPNLTWVKLSQKTVLIGVDGWYDGRGALSASHINDSSNILEFVGKNDRDVLELMGKLSVEEAYKLDCKLDYVGSDYENVIIATHVPAFKQVLWRYPNETDMSQFMMSADLGDVIVKHAAQNKSVNYTLLCGHTHRFADMYLANNIRCFVAANRYLKPYEFEVHA